MAIAEHEIMAAEFPASQEERPVPFRWTIQQFHDAGEMGLFEGQPVMLIQGEILAMSPINPPHQGTTTIVGDVLRAAFGGGFVIREQGPFNIGNATDPQPDVAVVEGDPRQFLRAHPTRAVLVVEVSDSTLSYDRHEKASLYAKAGIKDYWIVNVNGAQLEVHRHPEPDETQPHGFGYAQRTTHKSGEIVHPLAAPRPVAVSMLLP